MTNEKAQKISFEASIEEIKRLVKHTVGIDILTPTSKVEDDLPAIAETMLNLEKAVVREYEQGNQSD